MTGSASQRLYDSDLDKNAQVGLDKITVSLTQTQQDAFGDFFFNAGPRGDVIRAANSDLWRAVNLMIDRYSRSGGRFSENLYQRRMWEATLILGHAPFRGVAWFPTLPNTGPVSDWGPE